MDEGSQPFCLMHRGSIDGPRGGFSSSLLWGACLLRSLLLRLRLPPHFTLDLICLQRGPLTCARLAPLSPSHSPTQASALLSETTTFLLPWPRKPRRPGNKSWHLLRGTQLLRLASSFPRHQLPWLPLAPWLRSAPGLSYWSVSVEPCRTGPRRTPGIVAKSRGKWLCASAELCAGSCHAGWA